MGAAPGGGGAEPAPTLAGPGPASALPLAGPRSPSVQLSLSLSLCLSRAARAPVLIRCVFWRSLLVPARTFRRAIRCRGGEASLDGNRGSSVPNPARLGGLGGLGGAAARGRTGLRDLHFFARISAMRLRRILRSAHREPTPKLVGRPAVDLRFSRPCRRLPAPGARAPLGAPAWPSKRKGASIRPPARMPFSNARGAGSGDRQSRRRAPSSCGSRSRRQLSARARPEPCRGEREKGLAAKGGCTVRRGRWPAPAASAWRQRSSASGGGGLSNELFCSP